MKWHWMNQMPHISDMSELKSKEWIQWGMLNQKNRIQAIYHLINHPNNQSINEPMNQSVNHSVDQYRKEKRSEWLNEMDGEKLKRSCDWKSKDMNENVKWSNESSPWMTHEWMKSKEMNGSQEGTWFIANQINNNKYWSRGFSRMMIEMVKFAQKRRNSQALE